MKRVAWRRFLIEGFVIVGSILLAFAIQAWWEESQESERLDRALENLEVALSQSLPLVDRQIARLEESREVLQDFLRATPEDLVGVSGDDARYVIGEVFRPRVSGLNSDEILSLLDDPALANVETPGYRAVTAQWRALWQNIRDRHASLLLNQDAAVRALALHPSTRTAIPGNEGVADMPADILAVARADESVTQLVASKLWYWSLLPLMYSELGDLAEEIAGIIREGR